MSRITAEEARAVLREAELLYPAEGIEAAFDRLAAAVTARLAACDPLILVVMNGAFMTAARLLARLSFPLRVGYVHATRYRGGTRGGDIRWIAPPPEVEGEIVLVVDDIFDQGDTLKAIVDEARRRGAAAVHSAVLIDKRHGRKVPGLTVDFVGLEAPDRYVFGCGMDYHEYWRQLPDLYAVREPTPDDAH